MIPALRLDAPLAFMAALQLMAVAAVEQAEIATRARAHLHPRPLSLTAQLSSFSLPKFLLPLRAQPAPTVGSSVVPQQVP